MLSLVASCPARAVAKGDASKSGNKWTPASKGVAPLTAWNRWGRFMSTVMKGKPVKNAALCIRKWSETHSS